MQAAKRDILAKIISTNANALINIVHKVTLEYVSSAPHCSGILMTAVVVLVAVTVKMTHVSVIVPVSIAAREDMVTSVRKHVVIGVGTNCVIEMVAVSLANMVVDMDQTVRHIVHKLLQIAIGVMAKTLTRLHVHDVTTECT